MTTTTNTTTNKAQPIPEFPLICNGDLNPLFRNWDDLQELVDAAELPEAFRIMRIHLECFHHVNADTVRAYSDRQLCEEFFRLQPRRYSREIVPGITTVAQFLAKYGNTSCRAECTDFTDLRRCFELAQAGFSAAWAEFNRAMYFQPDNPNNGRDLFKYEYGREGSTVVYIHYASAYKHALTPDWRHFERYTPQRFRADCQRLGQLVGADESWPVEPYEGANQWRLWWD